MDYFTNMVNVVFVAAIIVIIQVLKEIFKAQKVEVKKNTWKIIVLIAGFPMAAFMCFIEGWIGETVTKVIFNYLVKSFIYSAASSLMYQTGKLSIMALFEKKNG